MGELVHYRRLWAMVTFVTVLLIGLTVTLNVMHAPPTWGARLVGGTPPVFVFFCIELISRIPATSKTLSFWRIAASVLVSILAFGISYQQQMEFIHSLGFGGWIAYIYPVIIDGVVVVATLSLVEVTRKVRALKAMLEPFHPRSDSETAKQSNDIVTEVVSKSDLTPEAAALSSAATSAPATGKRGRRPGPQPNQPRKRTGGRPKRLGAGDSRVMATAKAEPIMSQDAPEKESVDLSPAMGEKLSDLIGSSPEHDANDAVVS